MGIRLLAILLAWLGLGVPLAAQVSYFPPYGLSSDKKLDKFISDWYSRQLKALQEPSLWELSKTKRAHAYRFLWLRTFHHPISVRIEVDADGTSRLTTRMTDGSGGYEPGKLIRNDSVRLAKEETDSFVGTIEQKNFWKLPSRDESRIGCDGAQWVIEGAKDGAYHFVDRWSPTEGEVREIGLVMVKNLAKLKLPSTEIY